jgi:hypothetical protein
MPSARSSDRPADEATIPFMPMPASVRPRCSGIVAAGGELPVDLDEIAHARNLGRENDPIVGQAGRLRQLGRADGALDHRLDHDVAGLSRLRQARIGVHHFGQHRLIQRAPVDADPDRLAVVHGHADDVREVVIVVATGAHVARIDAVLRESASRLRELREQLVPVVVEVADDRDGRAQIANLARDLRHCRRGRLGVDRDTDQLRTGVRQPGDLYGGRIGVRGVRVGHGLDDDGMARSDDDAVNIDGRRAAAGRELRDSHGYGAPPRTMSKKVIQPMKTMSNANPARYANCSTAPTP